MKAHITRRDFLNPTHWAHNHAAPKLRISVNLVWYVSMSIYLVLQTIGLHGFDAMTGIKVFAIIFVALYGYIEAKTLYEKHSLFTFKGSDNDRNLFIFHKGSVAKLN